MAQCRRHGKKKSEADRLNYIKSLRPKTKTSYRITSKENKFYIFSYTVNRTQEKLRAEQVCYRLNLLGYSKFEDERLWMN